MGDRAHVLHSGEGTVHSVRWSGNLIAWANDLGVKIYDAAAHARLTFIDRPKGSPRADAFRPHLVWVGERLLIIGWADCVKIARLARAPARTRAVAAQRKVKRRRRRAPQGARALQPEEALEALERGMEGAPTAALAAVRTCEICAVFQTGAPQRLSILRRRRATAD